MCVYIYALLNHVHISVQQGSSPAVRLPLLTPQETKVFNLLKYDTNTRTLLY